MPCGADFEGDGAANKSFRVPLSGLGTGEAEGDHKLGLVGVVVDREKRQATSSHCRI